MIVIDGNTAIHCEENEHTFFINHRTGSKLLYQNDNDTECSFDYKTKYKFINNQ